MGEKLVLFIKNLPVIRRIIAISKVLILPGFGGMPVYDISQFFIDAIKKGAITTRASAVSFKFFLALFPGIIFLFSLIPYIPIDNFQNELLHSLRAVLPEAAYKTTSETIIDLIKNKHGSLLSFGFITALYFATNGIMALLDAFNESYLVSDTRGNIQQRLVAIMLTIILTFIIMTGTSLIVFSQVGIDLLIDFQLLRDDWSVYLLQLGDWLILLGLIYFGISSIYYFGPTSRTKWKFFSPGSTIATLLILITSLGFAYFVNNFGQYNKLYGSIGTLIVIMLWINFNSTILIIGFELNASLKKAFSK